MSNSRLVYSTERGRLCPECGASPCRCKQLAAARPQGDGLVKVAREKGGRGGKTVTVVRGLPLALAELESLGKQLKAQCGSGGTVKDGVIEVQGDHVERVMAALQAKGYKPKRVGG